MSAPFIVSEALAGVRHGFFGREGGISQGHFASLNMSLTGGDNPAFAQANRAAAAKLMGRRLQDLVVLKQVHSTKVVTIHRAPGPREVIEGDAMVTNQPGLLLGILTADCAPILFADPKAGVIGAAHAGWKGAAGGIAYATRLAMVALGADPANIRAAIGPTISGANYEVGPDTAHQIAALDPGAARRIHVPGGRDREHFDIPGFLGDQLRGSGVGMVEVLGLCTYADPVRFFSHRYATHHGTTTGRQIALIGLN